MYDCTFSVFPDFQASFREEGVISDAVNFTGGFGMAAAAKCIPLERQTANKHQIGNTIDKYEPLSLRKKEPLKMGAIAVFFFFDGHNDSKFPFLV